jgi:hypothetical protein
MSVSDRVDDWPASPLQAAARAFAALTVDPAPLTLDCAAPSPTPAHPAPPPPALPAQTAAGTTGTFPTGTAGTTPRAPAGSAGTPQDAGTEVPAGAVPLPALRDWLVAHPSAYTVRDAVWRGADPPRPARQARVGDRGGGGPPSPQRSTCQTAVRLGSVRHV